ncbi:RING finger protein 32 [Dinochytrium kinnereticum]|nr:RING finger protein 32 [Dinochytrium kinnereticum]
MTANAPLWAAALQEHFTAAAGLGAQAPPHRSNGMLMRQREKWKRQSERAKATLAPSPSVRLPPIVRDAPQKKEKPILRDVAGGGNKPSCNGSVDGCGVKKGGRLEDMPDVKLDPPAPLPTLAQKLGIVAPPPKRMTITEWDSVKELSRRREDWKKDCSICCEPICKGRQALLSCSHTFHLACLKSFERHSGGKRCPLCRTSGYETIATSDAQRKQVKDDRLLECADMATWRMWKARKAYLAHRATVPPKNPLLLKRFHEKKFTLYHDELRQREERATRTMEEMLKSLEDEVENSRKLFNSAIDLLTTPSWDNVLKAVLKRTPDPYHENCAICLSKLGERQVSLLTCSHMFHEKCIAGLELFCDQKATCPICRGQYTRTCMDTVMESHGIDGIELD